MHRYADWYFRLTKTAPYDVPDKRNVDASLLLRPTIIADALIDALRLHKPILWNSKRYVFEALFLADPALQNLYEAYQCQNRYAAEFLFAELGDLFETEEKRVATLNAEK